jgi:hypothetical protein
MALTATDCHKSVTVDDTSVTISGNQWLSGSNQRPSGGYYRSLPSVDGAQDAIEDRVAPTRAHLRLKVNQRSIRGQLEVIGALSRARRLVRTVLILARFHADDYVDFLCVEAAGCSGNGNGPAHSVALPMTDFTTPWSTLERESAAVCVDSTR